MLSTPPPPNVGADGSLQSRAVYRVVFVGRRSIISTIPHAPVRTVTILPSGGKWKIVESRKRYTDQDKSWPIMNIGQHLYQVPVIYFEDNKIEDLKQKCLQTYP